MEKAKIQSIIESILFVSGGPLSLKRMSDIVSEAPPAEVREAVEELVKECQADNRGVRMVEVAGGYQFQTEPENSYWVGRLLQSRPVRLSRASLETLAIVAYKQPVTRPEIEEVRGVDSGGVLKTLLEHGFIRIAGRKDVPGKPLIYATDKRFMEFFRLKSLAELPTIKELTDIQQEQLDARDAQAELPLDQEETGDEEQEENAPGPEADNEN